MVDFRKRPLIQSVKISQNDPKKIRVAFGPQYQQLNFVRNISKSHTLYF